MQVKKFYATNVAAAIRDIRRTLGPNALILSTRTVSNTGMVVNGTPVRVEVTAARETSGEAVSIEEVGIRTKEKSNGTEAIAVPVLPSSPTADFQQQTISSSPRMATDTLGNAATDREERTLSAQPSKAALCVDDRAHSASSSKPALQSVLAELKSLRDRLEGVDGPNWKSTKDKDRRIGINPTPRLSPTPFFIAPPTTDSLDKASLPPFAQKTDFRSNITLPARVLQERLRSQGVEEALIGRIVERMYFHGTTARSFAQAPQDGSDIATRRAGAGLQGTLGDFAATVSGFIPILNSESPQKGPRRIALVGPTGVGKTTALVKIASLGALRHNLRVGLATLDTCRVAAPDQIRTYAKLLGVPIEIVTDPSRLSLALDRFADMDMVLVDTPGYSSRDLRSVERLGKTLRETETSMEVHLVLTATQRGEEMRRTMQSFQSTGFDRLIFSKLDEAGSWGELLNTWVLGGYGVSYFTTGQRIPEDLETASVDGLCSRLAIPEEEEQVYGPSRNRA